jgi:DNA-binding CsgD family transcriptional regulator
MSTVLSIQVSSPLQPAKLETDFLCNEEWTADSEALLLQRVHEILAMIRNNGKSLRLNLEVEVGDPADAMFLIKKKIHHPSSQVTRQHKLSIREIEVLELIIQGNTNTEIAVKLFISYETVKSHRKHILTKTGARNTAALINYYHQAFSRNE